LYLFFIITANIEVANYLGISIQNPALSSLLFWYKLPDLMMKLLGCQKITLIPSPKTFFVLGEGEGVRVYE
jgi:hypothetical protein